jgi:hypothetical protein
MANNMSNGLQEGPRNPDKYSKWPYFLRLYGSVFPKLIVPVLFAGGWATAVTCISKYVYDRMYSPFPLSFPGCCEEVDTSAVPVTKELFQRIHLTDNIA